MPADVRMDRPDRPRRVLAYCHDSVGIGHLRRTLSICERVGAEFPGTSFLLATGTPYVQLLTSGQAVDFIKLPALTKNRSGGYESKYLAIPPDQIMRCRESLLLEAARTYEPDMLLVDKAPLGVCRELLPTLRWLREKRPHVTTIFGMRDIEDDAEATIRQWTRDGVPQVLEECYDRIWVYGMRQIHDVIASYRLSDKIARKLQYMGYVTRGGCSHAPPTSDASAAAGKTVLVTVGGGTDGGKVLSAYLDGAARGVAAAGARSVIVGGPDLPAETGARLQKLASETPGTQWLDFEPCMSCRIRAADLVVCMGGYNTLCEVAAQRKPALVIPRTQPRLEQKIRAELWQKLGVVRMLTEPEFSARALASHTLEMLANPPRPTVPLDIRGLDRVSEEFHDMWAAPAGDASTRSASHNSIPLAAMPELPDAPAVRV